MTLVGSCGRGSVALVGSCGLPLSLRSHPAADAASAFADSRALNFCFPCARGQNQMTSFVWSTSVLCLSLGSSIT